MKRFVVMLICALILAIGGVSAYYYLTTSKEPEYKNGMFVDRGETYGYAAMYDLSKSV